MIPTALLAFPVWQLLGTHLDHSVHAARLAQQLDLTAISDLLGSQSRSGPAFSHAALAALVVTLLLSPLLSGMAVTAARSGGRPGFGQLFSGGANEYLRMLRMLVWAVVPLGSALAIGGAAADAAASYGERAILESSADTAALAASLLALLLFALADVTLDAGRAALAADRRRTSAIKAWWDGCTMLMDRPLASLGAWFSISLAGLLLAGALGLARINMPHVDTAGFIAALVLTQLIVLVVAWMRSARLFALVELARSRQPHAAPAIDKMALHTDMR